MPTTNIFNTKIKSRALIITATELQAEILFQNAVDKIDSGILCVVDRTLLDRGGLETTWTGPINFAKKLNGKFFDETLVLPEVWRMLSVKEKIELENFLKKNDIAIQEAQWISIQQSELIKLQNELNDTHAKLNNALNELQELRVELSEAKSTIRIYEYNTFRTSTHNDDEYDW